MDQQQRHKALRSVMWDNSISPEDMEKLLDGKILAVGHFTREKLFVRMLTGLPWYTIISLIPVTGVLELLTDEVLGQLWPKSLQEKYKYVKKRLQETIPDTR